ncbi:histone-lysine N-methyltransferase SETMAR [Trichonephila clavipes]|nr:histone-lysine N-methyltransferase SETMAR [Trichonephila clavipes]
MSSPAVVEEVTCPLRKPKVAGSTPARVDRVLKIEVNKVRIRYILQFFFDKNENASQVAEIVNGVYSAHTVTANYVQFWCHRFRSGIFDVKVVPRTGRPIIENVDKITEITEVDQASDGDRATYDNIVLKRSWSKSGEAAQTVAKPGLMAREVLLCIWWDWKGMSCFRMAKQ